MDILRPKWDEIPNSHFGSHFFDSLVRIVAWTSTDRSSFEANEASRLRKPLARFKTEGVTHVLSEKKA